MLILNVRRMNDHCHDQAQRIDHNMPFSSGNVFRFVITTLLAADFGRVRRLRVDTVFLKYCRPGESPFFLFFTHQTTSRIVNSLPNSIVAPMPKDIVNRFPFWKR